MPSLDEIMKMAEAAQAQLQQAQDNLDKVEVEGVSGGGLVRIKATAKGRILGVSIDESLLAPAEKTMLEDLIAAAINDAGDVVGTSGGRAVVWQAGAIQDLNLALPRTSGWRLESASGINNLGQIVGTGTHDGLTRAFLLTPS